MTDGPWQFGLGYSLLNKLETRSAESPYLGLPEPIDSAILITSSRDYDHIYTLRAQMPFDQDCLPISIEIETNPTVAYSDEGSRITSTDPRERLGYCMRALSGMFYEIGNLSRSGYEGQFVEGTELYPPARIVYMTELKSDADIVKTLDDFLGR